MLYANTDDGSSALWVLDTNGVVVDNVSYALKDRARILAQINEHYGTSFTGWSDNEIGLRLGDTIPNWSAYEKIELPETTFVKYFIESENSYLAGYIDNQNLKLKIWSTYNQQAVIQFNNSGKKITVGGQPQWNNDFLNAVNSKGIDVESAELEDMPEQPDDTIQNWQEYMEV